MDPYNTGDFLSSNGSRDPYSGYTEGLSSTDLRGGEGSYGGVGSSDSIPALRSVMSVEHERTKNPASHRLHPGTGAALILTTLICICLLCYAALTVVSAQADRRLTAQYEERTAEYYDAYRAGQAFLSDVDGQLRDLYEETYEFSDDASPEAMYYSAASALASAVDPDDADGEWYDEIHSVLAGTENAAVADGFHASAEEGADAGNSAGADDDDPAAASSEPAVPVDASGSSAPLLLFTQKISDTQVYFLLLRVQYPADISRADDPEDSEGSVYYRILSSKTVTTVTYDYDTTLDVITK